LNTSALRVEGVGARSTITPVAAAVLVDIKQQH
jgi:hypothetical protein